MTVTTRRIGLLVVSVMTALVVAGCGSTENYLQPSGHPAFVPQEGTEFSAYVESSKANIQTVLTSTRKEGVYLGGYTLEQAAAMRAPFQLLPSAEAECAGAGAGGAKGFLLIHGLTDSPYLLRSVADSLHQAYPCSLIRAVLLPGHGTIAGDSLTMDRRDWQRVVRYGIASFRDDKAVADLYLIGFSTGTALTIDYLHEHRNPVGRDRDDKIRGVVLLSAAVQASSGFAWFTSIGRYFKDWMAVYPERDAARYESFSVNAGYQFYRLTKGMASPDYGLNIPLLMVVSADDHTVSGMAAREFYCYTGAVQRKALLWYQSADPAVNARVAGTARLACDNIIEINLADLEQGYNTINLSHLAVSVSPADAHYGFNGRYHHCKEYDAPGTQDDFNRCQSDDAASTFGENPGLLKKLGKDEGKFIRRGTFNPDYERVERDIICFVDAGCPLERITGEKSELW